MIGPLNHVTVLPYDTEVFTFRCFFEQLLGSKNLEYLHNQWKINEENYLEKAKHGQRICEEAIGENWEVLNAFLSSVIEPLCGKILARQKVPTVRFHFAIGSAWLKLQKSSLENDENGGFIEEFYFNKPRARPFHRDGDYHVDRRAINLWVPVTDVAGANSLWIGGPDHFGKDAVPLSMRHGEFLLFHAISRWHGVVWNSSSTTRVSFDTRLVLEQESDLVRSLRLGS